MRTLVLLACLLCVACGRAPDPAPPSGPPPVATFSIVAFDEKSGDLGVAVQSRFFGVGAVVPSDRAAESARSAWMRLDPEQGLGATYVAPRHQGDEATIFFAARGDHRLKQRALVRDGAIWTLAP